MTRTLLQIALIDAFHHHAREIGAEAWNANDRKALMVDHIQRRDDQRLRGRLRLRRERLGDGELPLLLQRVGQPVLGAGVIQSVTLSS